MNCRRFLRTMSMILAAPLVAEAQPTGKVYQIGFLRAGAPPPAWVEAFKQGLRELGYIDGRNVVIELQLTDGSTEAEALPRLANELVRSQIDVILASSGPPALAVKQATTSVPIVFVNVVDSVEMGLVKSLGRAGGNLTGLTPTSDDLTGKRLELLKELRPKLTRVAVLSHPAALNNRMQVEGAQVAARHLGVQPQLVPVEGPDDLSARSRRCKALTGSSSSMASSSRRI